METGEINMNSQARNLSKRKSEWIAALMLLTAVCVAGCSGKSPAETPAAAAQTNFATPAEAGQALQSAAKTGDESALARILGPNSKDILNSGDPVEDKAVLASFVSKYDQMNRWVPMNDGTQILNIGADNYPFPIPLAKDSSSKWYFNTKAGEDEIIARQIGRNELLAMDACSSIANAEELYFQKPHDGNPAHQYTTKILSSAGKQDGLHWEVPEGQDASPLGRLSDLPKGSVSSTSSESPVIDGYTFRILTAQGDKAKGGAKSYLVNGKLTGGFAVIAVPVKYRDSGIATFIISREGVVYQKDLGANTSDAAASIKEYNPADGWTEAE
jgi:Protein of unknown function (DUF2950)